MSEFWRDENMDSIIQSIIDLFNNIEGVELIRLNGLTKYLNKINNRNISKDDIEMIISKLNKANIINYIYKYSCPQCKETSYVLIPKQDAIAKLCDTCGIFYTLENNKTLFKNIK